MGELAPDFTLQTDAGKPLTLSSLRGKRVLLYFYPKDSSTGCTAQASELRDLFPRFRRDKVVVLGVGPGSVKSKAKFRAAHELPFTLLADSEQVAAKAFGLWREKMLYGKKYMGMMRTTYLISAEGVVERIWENVSPAGHAAEVSAFIRGKEPAPETPARAKPKR